MAIESATHIHQLNQSYPDGTVDQMASVDNHIRLIKSVLLATFPNITGDLSATQHDLSSVTYVVDSSVNANTVTVAPSPAWTAYTAGKGLVVKLANTNTGSSTINVNRTWSSQHHP